MRRRADSVTETLDMSHVPCRRLYVERSLCVVPGIANSQIRRRPEGCGLRPGNDDRWRLDCVNCIGNFMYWPSTTRFTPVIVWTIDWSIGLCAECRVDVLVCSSAYHSHLVVWRSVLLAVGSIWQYVLILWCRLRRCRRGCRVQMTVQLCIYNTWHFAVYDV